MPSRSIRDSMQVRPATRVAPAAGPAMAAPAAIAPPMDLPPAGAPVAPQSLGGLPPTAPAQSAGMRGLAQKAAQPRMMASRRAPVGRAPVRLK